MIVRALRPGEEAALWSIFHGAVHRVARADYTPAQREAWAPGVPDLDRWARRVRALAPWVAEENGELLGYADLQDDGLVDHLFVHPDHQRRGVASRLLQRVFESARQRHLARVYTHASLTARPFFEHHGFRVRERREVARSGQVLTNFLMERSPPRGDAQPG